MNKIRKIQVENLGYASPDSEAPDISPVEIWGLSNQGDERFDHIGYAYPDLSSVDIIFVHEIGGATEDKTMYVVYSGGDLDIGESVDSIPGVPQEDWGL